jgi:hypothetical protein
MRISAPLTSHRHHLLLSTHATFAGKKFLVGATLHRCGYPGPYWEAFEIGAKVGRRDPHEGAVMIDARCRWKLRPTVLASSN